jgi:hypothetical protein
MTGSLLRCSDDCFGSKGGLPLLDQSCNDRAAKNMGGVSQDFSLRRTAFRCHQAPELISFGRLHCYILMVVFCGVCIARVVAFCKVEIQQRIALGIFASLRSMARIDIPRDGVHDGVCARLSNWVGDRSSSKKDNGHTESLSSVSWSDSASNGRAVACGSVQQICTPHRAPKDSRRPP